MNHKLTSFPFKVPSPVLDRFPVGTALNVSIENRLRFASPRFHFCVIQSLSFFRVPKSDATLQGEFSEHGSTFFLLPVFSSASLTCVSRILTFTSTQPDFVFSVSSFVFGQPKRLGKWSIATINRPFSTSQTPSSYFLVLSILIHVNEPTRVHIEILKPIGNMRWQFGVLVSHDLPDAHFVSCSYMSPARYLLRPNETPAIESSATSKSDNIIRMCQQNRTSAHHNYKSRRTNKLRTEMA